MEMTINRRYIITILWSKLGFFGAFSGRFGIFRTNVVVSHLLKSWKISMTLEAWGQYDTWMSRVFLGSSSSLRCCWARCHCFLGILELPLLPVSVPLSMALLSATRWKIKVKWLLVNVDDGFFFNFRRHFSEILRTDCMSCWSRWHEVYRGVSIWLSASDVSVDWSLVIGHFTGSSRIQIFLAFYFCFPFDRVLSGSEVLLIGAVGSAFRLIPGPYGHTTVMLFLLIIIAIFLGRFRHSLLVQRSISCWNFRLCRYSSIFDEFRSPMHRISGVVRYRCRVARRHLPSGRELLAAVARFIARVAVAVFGRQWCN